MKSVLIAALGLGVLGVAQPIRPNPAFKANSIARNDDGSSAITPLGFTINFFGKLRNAAFVNNNGNITFDAALPTYTPFGLQRTSREIIAPFFADVDTRGGKSLLVSYGQDNIDGKNVFGVNYADVGYYNAHDDKLNRFQLIVTERPDTGAGNFDIEFNYERIAWETGDASGGTNGFGGVPAVVGWSNGSADPGTSFELAGSMVSGAFLDGGPNALVKSRLNNLVVGRLLFRARDGVLSPGLSIQTGPILPDAVVGQRYTYRFDSAGTKGAIRWELTPDVMLPPGFSASSDGMLSGIPTTTGTYAMTAAATATIDGESQTVFKRVSISVRPAKLVFGTACPLPGASVGAPYSFAFRATGAPGAIAWSVRDRASLPAGLSLASTGLIAGTPLAAGTFDFVVRAEAADGSVQGVENSCRLTVQPAAVGLAEGCALPPAFSGVPYSRELLPTGGVAPYRFEAVGQIPPGMVLTSDGTVAGTAEVPAYYPFGINITDSRGFRIAYDCSLEVRPTSVHAASKCPLPPALTSETYGVRLSADGGKSPYVWSVAGTLPPGLSLSPEGSISGRPLSAGPYLFRLIATDANGEAAGQPCSLSVIRGKLSIGSCPLPDAVVGQNYQAQLSGVGGTDPYSWTASGQLPSGLTVNRGGGVTGMATVLGRYSFTVGIVDAEGASAFQTCAIAVRPSPLQFASTCPMRTATLGQSYSARLTASGGTPPYAFRVGALLPDGIAATPDGGLSGTPTAVGTSSFNVRVTDSTSSAIDVLCSLDVEIPKLPSIRIVPPAATVASASPGFLVTVAVSEPYTLPITGTMTLAVNAETRNSDGSANQPDPRVRFENGQLSIPFVLRPGATAVSIPLLTTGTVASSMAVSLSNLRAGGVDLRAGVTPRVFRVAPAVPTISSACYSATASGFDVVLLGMSNTRELKGAEVAVGSETIQSSLRDASAEYFTREETIRNGGAFSLRVPVHPKAPPSSTIMVKLTNSVGESTAASATRCP